MCVVLSHEVCGISHTVIEKTETKTVFPQPLAIYSHTRISQCFADHQRRPTADLRL